MHVPIELAETARATARDIGADGIVCIGGGSATGLAKAIAPVANTTRPGNASWMKSIMVPRASRNYG